MKDKEKTKDQLINELVEMRKRISELGVSETEHKRAEETLRESEERFRSFLDDLADIAYTTDSQGNVTYANKMAEKVTGMPLEDIIGKPFLPLFTEENQKIAIDVYQRTLNGESPEYELAFINGRICQFKNEPLRNKHGKIIGVFGIARDITERKWAEEALKESEEKYRKLMETANDAIFIADVETGIILDVNKKVEELLGMPAEKIVGMHQTQLHPKEEAERYSKVFLDHIQSGKAISGDLFVCHKDGHKIPVEISASITELMGKKVIQGIFRDITERRRAQEALQESEEKYRNLFENANDAIFLTGVETGIILDANTKAEGLTGYPKEEIIGIHQSKLYPSGCGESYWKFRKHVRKGDNVDLEAGVIKKDGSIVPVFISASRIRLGGKKVVQAIFRDLTEARRASELSEEILARKLIDKAKGILMDRHGISEKEAIRRLQKESRNQSRKMKEIALDVITSESVLN